jgi:hypothetical protein
MEKPTKEKGTNKGNEPWSAAIWLMSSSCEGASGSAAAQKKPFSKIL